MEDQVSLMNKKAEDLTVGDALKINAIATGIMLGAFAVIVGAPVAVEKVSRWNRNRKARHLELVTDEL
jgi:hypothetical protein